MIAAFFALLPVFLTIVAGYGLRRTGLIAEGHWVAVDHLCYYVLFPVIIFKEIASADFTGVPVWGMAISMMLAIIAMSVVLFALRQPLQQSLRLDGPSYSSFFQGATRWHTFIALAIIPVYFGQGALALGGLAAAAMTPLLNIINVAVISYTARGEPPTLREVARSLLRNPFIIASVSAVLWRVLGLPMPEIAVKTLAIIGSGALGLALLAAGAGLRIDEALSAKAPVIAATALKLLAMPALMALFLTLFGITGQPFAVAMLCAAVPTGSGAYVLARQMGGDAPLIANILTLQVICAVVTIPLVLGWFA